MQAWLASHWELIFAICTAFAGGWIGVNRRRDRQLKECRENCRKLTARNKMLQRDYTQVLEFNFQDRYTIRQLGLMVGHLRKQLNLPEVDILLTLSVEAEQEMKARRLAAQHGIHQSSATTEMDDFDLT
jgi:NAD(P)H-dependent flavin oxidoreductase YrpB (nitropropane dioxygenase family)